MSSIAPCAPSSRTCSPRARALSSIGPVARIASENLSWTQDSSDLSCSGSILSPTPTVDSWSFILSEISAISVSLPKISPMSTNRRPIRSALSRYAGPMPLPVVPTSSSAESYSLWKGSITAALSLMKRRLPSGLSPVSSAHSDNSLSRTHGSTTMPHPSTRLQSLAVIPDGSKCILRVVPPATIV